MAYIKDASRDGTINTVKLEIEFEKDNFEEKSKAVMLRIKEALKDENVEISRFFDDVFGTKIDAETARELAEIHRGKIMRKLPYSDEYQNVKKAIENAVKKGFYSLVYDYDLKDAVIYYRIKEILESEGFICEIENRTNLLLPSHVIGKRLIVGWGVETEDKKHAE